MEVPLSPDLQAKLNRLAAQQGRATETLAVEAIERMLGYDEWFVREVKKGLAAAGRGELTDHDDVRSLIDERYPSFRLFLFDARERFSIPYTIFGSSRVAVFAGQMYLVLNSSEAIRTMQMHFEGLIRDTRIHAHQAADFVRSLTVS